MISLKICYIKIFKNKYLYHNNNFPFLYFKIIFIIGRQSPSETTSSFVIEEFLKNLLINN